MSKKGKYKVTNYYHQKFPGGIDPLDSHKPIGNQRNYSKFLMAVVILFLAICIIMAIYR